MSSLLNLSCSGFLFFLSLHLFILFWYLNSDLWPESALEQNQRLFVVMAFEKLEGVFTVHSVNSSYTQPIIVFTQKLDRISFRKTCMILSRMLGMIFNNKSIIVLLLALSSLSVLAKNSSITRSESVGVVSGILASKTSIAAIPLMYNSSRENMARAYGFKAKYPLELFLGNSSYRSCRMYYKDESYTAEEYIAFVNKYAGANIELSGVQRHYGAGGLQCTFTGFKVLSSAEDVAKKKVEQQKAQQDNVVVADDHVIGDMPVSVLRLMPDFVLFRLLGEDGNPVKDPQHECGNRIYLDPAINRNAFHALRAELQKNGNRATLKNVLMTNGKCTAERVVQLIM